MSKPNKIVVAISGASGAVYAKQLLERLNQLSKQFEEVSIVFSDTAISIWKDELPEIDYNQFPFKIYKNNDFYAPFASGSANYDTMIIIPCSMGMLGRIANGFSDDLISRAADVMLKESRNLILVPREAPYNLIHVKNMEKIILAGGKICPASPSFYSKPQNIDDLVGTIVDRVMDLAGIEIETFRWGE
jgi:4-hydroxy-3-polyprenylbenzoate decarboxylase